MDGAFLVRWSEAKDKFVLSMKHFDHHQEEWLIKNYEVRVRPENRVSNKISR